MKQTVTESMFVQAFLTSDERKEQFSYDGLKALFAYCEELEDDCGEQVEFDMVALCCEFTEYDDIMAVFNAHDGDLKTSDYVDFEETNKDLYDSAETVKERYNLLDDVNRETFDDDLKEYLQDNTQVIELDNGGFIIQDF